MKTILLASIWAMGWNTISMNETVEASEVFSYDMNVGGEQSAYIETESGIDLLVTIVEIDEPVQNQSFNRVSSSLELENKTYLVKGSLPLYWDASYKITVNNRLITRAFESKVTPLSGKISQRKLIRESSNKRARLEFKVSPLIGSDKSGKLVSTINGSQLIISK
ncbi:DUF5626 family protein [Marinilactibacillus sp. Marseille-P9653]|uniref:DUF5626 family protein n=1 Tax=Marinilactibacillus sp. Marseille-P9653 TaxID=2866583 RepID=UPI001CE45BEE|nr:DUF5626 family protein [Marinilactibacillus sp. Marseille-P9653]